MRHGFGRCRSWSAAPLIVLLWLLLWLLRLLMLLMLQEWI
jgi:hypothetical protein